MGAARLATCAIVAGSCALGGISLESKMSGTNQQQDDAYSEKETAARAEAALKRMLATPPKLHKDSKVGRKRGI